MFDMLDTQIEIHKKEIDFDSVESTDYVEAYLKEQKRLENEPDNGGFTHAQLRNMCFDLWLAGMETTSNTLYWGVLYVEVQRLSNLLPVNVFHETTCDVEIEGYQIPAGTLVLPQISTVMYDEKVFPKPYDFDPRRHLSENGTFVRIDEVVPFSMGKRQCLGESIARMERCSYFLAKFPSIKFEVTTYGDQRPSTVKKFAATVRAQDFCVVLKERH
ncbi:hypothetical protein COOONC_02630 [Cooperia oncophora]